MGWCWRGELHHDCTRKHCTHVCFTTFTFLFFLGISYFLFFGNDPHESQRESPTLNSCILYIMHTQSIQVTVLSLRRSLMSNCQTTDGMSIVTTDERRISFKLSMRAVPAHQMDDNAPLAVRAHTDVCLSCSIHS